MIVKVIEVIAESTESWEDAAKAALREASKTLRNIKSIYVKDMQATVKNNHIVTYRINAKISFVIENNRSETDQEALRVTESLDENLN